jgi:hypothetical protein
MGTRKERPKPRLYTPVEQFGRRCEQLSPEELEREQDTILRAVATGDELDDWYQRHELATRVCEALRSIVPSIENPVDRRMAQVVLATEREFWGKGVLDRLAYVATHGCEFSDNQFWDRRGYVIEYLAAKLEEALAEANSETTANPAERAGIKSARRRLMVMGATAAVLVLLATAGTVVALTRGNAAQNACNGMSAAELEHCYDGKLPWGDDEESHCANPPDAQNVVSNNPPVMVPDGRVTGTLQLRKSPICPTAVWARIVWDGDEGKRYQIPAGWTVHSVMHRPATNTVIPEQDHPSATEGPYIVSRMISSARGCVYAEVYFARDDKPDVTTATARTSCVWA